MQRYEYKNRRPYSAEGWWDVVEDDEGEYVRYEDAQAEIARLTAEVERLSKPCEWSACMRRKPTVERMLAAEPQGE